MFKSIVMGTDSFVHPFILKYTWAECLSMFLDKSEPTSGRGGKTNVRRVAGRFKNMQGVFAFRLSGCFPPSTYADHSGSVSAHKEWSRLLSGASGLKPLGDSTVSEISCIPLMRRKEDLSPASCSSLLVLGTNRLCR